MRALLAITAWFGAMLQLCLSISFALANGKSAAAGVADYLSYFTMLTNIFLAIVSIAPTAMTRVFALRWFAAPMVVGCATASSVLVFAVYHFLLRQPPHGLQGLSNIILHYAVPMAALAYGLLYLHTHNLPWWSPLAWSLYPVAYFVYVFVRGALTGSYPYWFMNIPALGYGLALSYGAALLGVFILIGYALLGMTYAAKKWNLLRGCIASLMLF